MITCGKLSMRVSKRFSELMKFHVALQKSNLGSMYGVVLPKFPSKRRMAGMHLIDPFQVALRVSELQGYFTELSKVPIVLTLDSFHEALGITALAKEDKAVAQLKETLEQCGHLALAAAVSSSSATSSSSSSSSDKSAATSSGSLTSSSQRKKSNSGSSSSSNSNSSSSSKKKKGKKLRKSSSSSSFSSEDDDFYDDEDDGKSALENDYLYSQKFHLLAKAVMNGSSSSGAPPPSSMEQEQLMRQAQAACEGDLDGTDAAAPIPALYFIRKLRFHLGRQFWAGDHSIREAPGGRVWFTMVGPIPSVAVGKNPRMNDYFALVNPTNSASPLVFMSIGAEKSFTIWEAMSDGLVGTSICTFNSDPPAPGAQDTLCYVMESESGNRQHITCSGTSPWKLTFLQDMKSVCATAGISPDDPEDFVVDISPHRDVLFYLIATIAIQKLENDEDDQKEEMH